MDKEKQIEEMANIISDCTWVTDEDYCDSISCEECHAKRLYEQGYRKIPEDSVVLTKEEAERFRMQTINIAKVKSQASKETAEKILDLLVPDCKACDKNWHSGCLCLRAKLAEKIAKQFGIEIKE